MINKAIRQFQGSIATGLRSICKVHEPPRKLVKISNGLLGALGGSIDIVNQPRQSFEQWYKTNGYIDIVRRNPNNDIQMFGQTVLPFETGDVGEVDSEEDFKYLEWRLERQKGTVYYELQRT